MKGSFTNMGTKTINPGDDISALYTYPVTANSGNLPYIQTQPLQNWVRPLVQGELPTDLFTYTYVATDPTSGAILTPTNTVTKGQASTLNMPPSGYIYPPGTTPNESHIPNPVDLALLPAGYVIVPNPLAAFGELPLIEPGGGMTEGQKIQKILNFVVRIANKVGA
jgi:hypothetical protein